MAKSKRKTEARKEREAAKSAKPKAPEEATKAARAVCAALNKAAKRKGA